MMKQKITYLFMVYKNADFVLHTCQQLAGEDVGFYVHVDVKSKEDFSILKDVTNLQFCDKQFSSEWGGPGFVYAIAHCLKQISEHIDTNYVVLMSESDYPVKDNCYIMKYLLNSRKDFATVSPLPCENPLHAPYGYWVEGGMRRVNCYAVRFGTKGIATIEPKKLNWGNVRQFGKLLIKAPSKLGEACGNWFKAARVMPDGIRWCGGDLWFSLRMETIKRIVAYLDHNDAILKEAKLSDCPDEVIFPTLIDAFSPAEERVDSILRYVNWPKVQADSPAYLTMEDTDIINRQIAEPDMLFVRKVEDMKVAEYIDKHILHS